MANPFVHVELMTSDLAKSKEFYQSMFDWKLEDVPEMNYTLIKVGEGTGGGMIHMPGMPSSWIPYVLVEDVAASTEKAKSLGATIIKSVTEIPGVGRFSVMADPNGATIALWQPKSEM